MVEGVKRLFILLIVIVIPLVLLKSASAQTVSEIQTSADSERVIVRFRPLVPWLFKDRLIKSYGTSISEQLRLPETFIVRVPERRAGELAARLRRNLLVEYAEPDYIAQATETPDDPLFSDQWGLAKIESPAAWDTTHGVAGVDIAIVDSGIEGSHPDLSSKITASVNCTISSSCPTVTAVDGNGHGTHVAGIASAITGNSTGVAGTSWEGRLLSVKVLDDSGSGYYSWVANGIYWAADNGAEVINLSLGGRYSSRTLRNAVDYAWSRGVVVVAAAGNTGSSSHNYPAYYSKAIAVAATDQSDQRASFSSYGFWVDVAAPGVSILSTYKGGYAYMSGTSMSTPHVAGLAGLLFGQHPGWSNSQVRNQIESTADAISGTGSYWAHGRINACSAVGCNVIPTPSPTVTPTPSPTSEPTPTPTPTPTPEPTPTPAVTPTPSPTSEPTPTSTPSPTPTPSPKPWWCRYVPWHRLCQ
jgi:thermitase